ncbi:unnamed protein product [Brugia timori]|uniref:PE-PGRS family protein n=1 Tax=Brugia timori TaxID=42155 RepID=A0A0R3QGV6_9BILA|nr:unnamed protein product [Brugia timori]
MGDRGARCVGAAMATGLREPQPRGRGIHRGAGTGRDGGEVGHLSAEAAGAVGTRWHAAVAWGGYTAASGDGSIAGCWAVGGSHRGGHCALTGAISWQPLRIARTGGLSPSRAMSRARKAPVDPAPQP